MAEAIVASRAFSAPSQRKWRQPYRRVLLYISWPLQTFKDVSPEIRHKTKYLKGRTECPRHHRDECSNLLDKIIWMYLDQKLHSENVCSAVSLA